MHFSRVDNDPKFRNVAQAVRLHAEDMNLVEWQPGCWCLPLEQFSSSLAIGRLYFQFEKTKLDEIIQRRREEQPAKRITRRHGPDILCFGEDTPPVPENQFLVGITLEKPSIQQDKASSTLKRRHEGDEIVTELETLPRRSENASSHEDIFKSHPKIDQDNDSELVRTNEKQKTDKGTTDEIASVTAEAPPEPSPQWHALVEKLKLEAEIVVSDSTLNGRADEPLKSEAADILELDAFEYLHIKTGCVVAMWISFNWA